MSMSKIVEYIIVADIFVRSKSGFEEVFAIVAGLAFSTGVWAAVCVELGEAAIVFLLHESKALGIVASRPQARMAED